MAIPIGYNLRNLRMRWRLTLATALGVALVVAVFIITEYPNIVLFLPRLAFPS